MRLTAESLGVGATGSPALEGVGLELAPGARAWVLGRSGSGKTTLLKALAGLVLPSSGRVCWEGEDVARLGAAERRRRQVAFGMVFQTDALFDSLTVRDNVLLPLRRRGVPEAEACARADEVLAAVGLGAHGPAMPENLSGGQKKRAGLARALVARPQVLLADDPLAGLDPGTARQVCRLLLEVSAGATLLVAGPDPVPDLPLPRWLVLREGRLVHDGPPSPAALEEDLA